MRISNILFHPLSLLTMQVGLAIISLSYIEVHGRIALMSWAGWTAASSLNASANGQIIISTIRYSIYYRAKHKLLGLYRNLKARYSLGRLK